MSKKNYSKWTKSAAASMLAFSLVATPYAISFGDQGANVSQKSASAAVLDIELLSNMTLTNNSGTTASNRFQLNPDGTQNVDFTISGASLAQASTITSGKKQVVLGVPEELQGLVQPNGNAQIDSSITVRINEVPLVAPVLDATNAVLDAIASALSATPGIQINLKEVNDQLNLLNNLGEAGQGTFTAPVTLNADGSVLSAPIDDGLGLILAQNLNTILTDLNNAIQALTATGTTVASNIAAAALNTTLIPLKATVSAAVSTLKALITAGGAIINQLADAAVLGDTEIIVPTKVTGPAEYLNTNPTLDAGFVGSVVKGNVITLDLFKSSDGKSTVYYQGNPDDFAVPATPTDVATAGNSTDGYEVTGKAEPNSDVTVYDKDGNKVGTGKADADGNFTISVPGSVGPEADLTVTATNANGESDPASTQTPADPVVVPEAPTDVATTGNSTDGYQVTGKTEPGATVNVYDKDGNEVGTGTADENGDFTITVPGSVGPEADLTVKAENSAGEGDGVNTKTPADPVVVPAAPTDVATTGNSTDGYEVTGKTEPGATVNVYDKDGNEVGTGTADADGNFTIDVPASVGPEADLTVKAENSAGEGEGVNTKTPADPAVAPEAPTDVATTGNSTDGYEVTGKTEPGATVNIYDKDGNKVGTGTADADGNFTITVPGSVGPEADLTVKAENSAGEGEGAATKTPADPVAVPAAPTDVTTTGNSTDGYEVVGKTEPGATVNIYDKDGNKVGTGTADADGNFTITVPGSVGPEADLTVKAENSAGEGDGVNTKTPADASTAAPTAPTDVIVDGNPVDGYEVTGKTDPNTDVTIYDKDGNEVGSGTSDANGDFTITVPGSVGPDAELTVTATNDNGSSSSNVTTPLVSGAITVNPMTQYNSIITGTAPKGTVKVKLIVNGRDLNTATVAADGTYSFDKKYVYDADGNKKLLGEGDEIQVVYYGPGKTSNVTPGNTVVGAKEYLVTLDNVVVKPGTAATISGTAGPEIQKVRLSVNGVDLVDGTVNADGTYSFSTKYVYTDATKTERKLIGAGDVVKVTAVDDDKPKTTIFAEKVVEEAGATPVEIISINKETFTISGTTDKDVTKVQLVVNGKALGTYAVTDGAFSIERKYVYEADGTTKKILGVGDEVMIRNAQTSIEGSATQVVQ